MVSAQFACSVSVWYENHDDTTVLTALLLYYSLVCPLPPKFFASKILIFLHSVLVSLYFSSSLSSSFSSACIVSRIATHGKDPTRESGESVRKASHLLAFQTRTHTHMFWRQLGREENKVDTHYWTRFLFKTDFSLCQCAKSFLEQQTKFWACLRVCTCFVSVVRRVKTVRWNWKR